MHSSSRTDPPGWTMHGHAGRGGRLDAVGERVEGVARAGAALGPAGGLLRRDLAGLDPVLLTGADAPGHAVLHEHDGCSTSPRRRCGRPARRRRRSAVGRLPLGDHPPVVSRVDAKWCGSCTRYPPVIWRTWRASASAARRFEQSGVLALGDRARRSTPSLVAGRDHDVGLRPATMSLDRGGVDRPVDRHDAAERRLRSSHSKASSVGLGERVGDRGAARVGVLDDGAGRLVAESADVVHEQPRGVGVVEVEVRQRHPGVLRDARPTSGCRATAVAARRAGAGSRRSAASSGTVERAKCERAAGSRSSPSSSHSTIAASYAAVSAKASRASARGGWPRSSAPLGRAARRARRRSRRVGDDRRRARGSWPRPAPSPDRRCR